MKNIIFFKISTLKNYTLTRAKKKKLIFSGNNEYLCGKLLYGKHENKHSFLTIWLLLTTQGSWNNNYSYVPPSYIISCKMYTPQKMFLLAFSFANFETTRGNTGKANIAFLSLLSSSNTFITKKFCLLWIWSNPGLSIIKSVFRLSS